MRETGFVGEVTRINLFMSQNRNYMKVNWGVGMVKKEVLLPLGPIGVIFNRSIQVVEGS